jgi:hypothetical protein
MPRYKRSILPASLVGTTAVASAFVTLMANRLRHTREGPKQAALADKEDEGGSMAAPDAATPLP